MFEINLKPREGIRAVAEGEDKFEKKAILF